MDRALVAVLSVAVGFGVLLAVAVVKNERTFTRELYAETRAPSPLAEPAASDRPSVVPATVNVERAAAAELGDALTSSSSSGDRRALGPSRDRFRRASSGGL